MFHWLLFISPLWFFTEHSQPGMTVSLIKMHCSCTNLHLVKAIYHRAWRNWVHRSALLVDHNSLERSSSVMIIYYCAMCQIRSSQSCFVLYFKDIMLLMSSKRKDWNILSLSAHCSINTYIFTELKSGALKKRKILILKIWNDNRLYTVLDALLGLFIIYIFLRNVTSILTLSRFCKTWWNK